MLTFDLARLMESKEIHNPIQFLMNAGFTRHTSHRLLRHGVESISYRNLEELCLALNCTPNELFSWVPGNGKPDDRIALHKLSGRIRKASFMTKLRSMPEEKLDQLRQYVDKLATD